MYESLVDEFQLKIISKRKDYQSFDEVMEYLLDLLFKRDPFLRANKKLTRVMLFYMYWNCDIGEGDDAAANYQDVFQLRRFVIGKHKDWKPYVAHILGFDHNLIEQYYAELEQLEEKKAVAETVKAELGGSVDELSKIEGILLLKQKDAVTCPLQPYHA